MITHLYCGFYGPVTPPIQYTLSSASMAQTGTSTRLDRPQPASAEGIGNDRISFER